MADFGNILQYNGRRFDVSAFRGATRVGEVLLRQTFFDQNISGEVVTAGSKLGQRFTLEFLTEQGSLLYLPDRGTPFMTLARQGRLRDEIDVDLAFEEALIPLETNLTAEEATYTTIEMPDDERYDQAELLNITISPGFLSMRVEVTSVAGDSREVILPIPTTPVDVSVV